MFDMHWQFKEI